MANLKPSSNSTSIYQFSTVYPSTNYKQTFSQTVIAFSALIMPKTSVTHVVAARRRPMASYFATIVSRATTSHVSKLTTISNRKLINVSNANNGTNCQRMVCDLTWRITRSYLFTILCTCGNTMNRPITSNMKKNSHWWKICHWGQVYNTTRLCFEIIYSISNKPTIALTFYRILLRIQAWWW